MTNLKIRFGIFTRLWEAAPEGQPAGARSHENWPFCLTTYDIEPPLPFGW